MQNCDAAFIQSCSALVIHSTVYDRYKYRVPCLRRTQTAAPSARTPCRHRASYACVSLAHRSTSLLDVRPRTCGRYGCVLSCDFHKQLLLNPLFAPECERLFALNPLPHYPCSSLFRWRCVCTFPCAVYPDVLSYIRAVS